MVALSALCHPLFRGLEEATIPELQAAMAKGETSSRRLVGEYLRRIARVDRAGPRLNSIAEVNPDALEIARQLDEER